MPRLLTVHAPVHATVHVSMAAGTKLHGPQVPAGEPPPPQAK